jgi:hypothetical protein
MGYAWTADADGTGSPCCEPNYNIALNPGSDGSQRIPRGFIRPYVPHPDLAHLPQAEIDALAADQHAPDCLNTSGVVDPLDPCCTPPDLAPEAMILHEEHREAVELDNLPIESDGFTPFQITRGDVCEGVQYDTPAGWEQALAEWEAWSRYCGPVERYRWEVTEDGQVTLMLISIAKVGNASPRIERKIEASQKQSILLRQYLAFREDMPDATTLTSRRAGYAEMRAEWGSKWNRILNERAPRPLSFEWPDVDDPYRHKFGETDPQLHTHNADLAYAGPVVLSHDDDDDPLGTEHRHIVIAGDGTELALREPDY